MNKSLLALAILAGFSSLAAAQSVTVSGRLNASVGKTVGTDQKQQMDIAQSLLAFSGTEQVTPKLLAFFGFEHRFASDTGTDASGPPTTALAAGATNTFWNGYSFIGLRHSDAGVLQFGRYYTAAFMGAQDRFDPWAGDTVAGLRNAIAPFVAPPSTTAGVALHTSILRARTANIAYYSYRPYAWTLSGTGFDFKVSAGVERLIDPFSGRAGKRPWATAVAYQNGPLYIGVGYEDPESKRDRMLTFGANYNLNVVKLSAAMSIGQDNSSFAGIPDPSDKPKKFRGFLIGATAPVGQGLVLAGYGRSEVQNNARNDYVDLMNKVSVGYRHYLSKRTWIYTDLAYDSKQRRPDTAGANVGQPGSGSQKLGYDLGLVTYF